MSPATFPKAPIYACSQFLPGRIYVGDFELKPGFYDLNIEFSRRFRNSNQASQHSSIQSFTKTGSTGRKAVGIE
jgi:hypothetical protein